MNKIFSIQTMKFLFLILVFSLMSSMSFGQALVNNPCPLPAPPGAEWPLDGVCYATTTAGFTNLFTPATCNATANDDGWAWFTGDGNNITIFFDPPNNKDPVMHVFDASGGCGAVLEVGCSDVCCNGQNETVTLTPSTLGMVYLIRIQDWGSNQTMTGCLSVTSTVPPVPGNGDDCATADRIDCGDPPQTGETSVGYTDDEGNWTCFAPITTPGGDHYYVVQWPDAANGGSIRIEITNVTDGNDTFLELMSLGNACAPPACVDVDQLAIATGLFGTGNTFIEFTVGAGVADYYFVVDSQNDGIDSYDITVTCFATGIELDVNSNCPPIPAGQPANQGYYVTWNGGAPPATADPVVMAATGPHTICENVYLENPLGWEWLKYFDIVLGECWINPTNLTPDTPPNNNGFFNLTGEWTTNIITGPPDTLRWDFTNSNNPTWGDGNACCFNCNLYRFCYTADVDPACNATTGFQNGISATDDGIGGGGGGAVNASNVTITSTGPTVLPVTLVSFTAKAVLNEGTYGVVLTWKTAAEINNDFFTIERSIDGVNFEEVLRMTGAGISTEINNYFAVDEYPYKGVSYYRLKQTDFNGAYEYFDMVSVNVSNLDDLILFPNPVTSDLNITLKSKHNNLELYIEIYDILGSLVIEQKNILTKGSNEFLVEMADYSQGLYFITVRYDNQIQKLKFLKN